MSTPEHREVAELLLGKARDDLRAANALIATENQADHIIGFHLQQAVEKALKSILVEHRVEIPRTHDLGYLIEVVSAQSVDLPAAVSESDWLTPWGVLFRYDDGPATTLDRDRALEAATSAIGCAEELTG